MRKGSPRLGTPLNFAEGVDLNLAAGPGKRRSCAAGTDIFQILPPQPNAEGVPTFGDPFEFWADSF
jgi:hypothetical protein